LINKDKKTASILERLASNEESVAKLYEGYANSYPVLNEFWISLATEEMKHASWIRNLGREVEKGAVFINEKRFNVVAVHSMTNYLKKELGRLIEQKIPIVEALSITLSIEQSLIESKFFEVFETDSVNLKHILVKIRDDTTKHREKSKEALETYKKTHEYG
jgi:rubrerythrin